MYFNRRIVFEKVRLFKNKGNYKFKYNILKLFLKVYYYLMFLYFNF